MNTEIDIEPEESLLYNPRENDNLGTMAFFHKRYRLGDNHKLTIQDAQNISYSKKYISIPVYMYDHGGIAISTQPFSCPWDSGQLGIIFVELKTALKEFNRKRSSKQFEKIVKNALTSEVTDYNNYLQS
jgi:hypothetical protein